MVNYHPYVRDYIRGKVPQRLYYYEFIHNKGEKSMIIIEPILQKIMPVNPRCL